MKEPKPVSAFQPVNESRNDLFAEFRKLRDEIQSLKSDFTHSQQPKGPQFLVNIFPVGIGMFRVPLLTMVFHLPHLRMVGLGMGDPRATDAVRTVSDKLVNKEKTQTKLFSPTASIFLAFRAANSCRQLDIGRSKFTQVQRNPKWDRT